MLHLYVCYLRVVCHSGTSNDPLASPPLRRPPRPPAMESALALHTAALTGTHGRPAHQLGAVIPSKIAMPSATIALGFAEIPCLLSGGAPKGGANHGRTFYPHVRQRGLLRIEVSTHFPTTAPVFTDTFDADLSLSGPARRPLLGQQVRVHPLHAVRHLQEALQRAPREVRRARARWAVRPADWVKSLLQGSPRAGSLLPVFRVLAGRSGPRPHSPPSVAHSCSSTRAIRLQLFILAVIIPSEPVMLVYPRSCVDAGLRTSAQLPFARYPRPSDLKGPAWLRRTALGWSGPSCHAGGFATLLRSPLRFARA